MRRPRKTLVVAFLCCVALVAAVMVYASGQTPPAREPEEVRTALEAGIREYEAEPHPRPPLFEPASRGVAADHYREAHRIFRAMLDGANAELRADAASLLSAADVARDDLPDSVRRSMERNGDGFLELTRETFATLRRGASSKESGRFTSLRNLIPESNERDAESQAARDLHSLLLVRSRLLARRGDPHDALENLLVLARFGADYGAGGSDISQKHGQDMQWAALAAIGRLLEGGSVSHADRDELRGHLKNWLGQPPERDALFDAVVLTAVWKLRLLADRVPGTEGLADLGELSRDRETLYRCADLMWHLAREARKQGLDDLSRASTWMGRRVASWFKWQILSGRPGTALTFATVCTGWCSEPLRRLERRIESATARREALTLALELLDYREQHGALPDSIERIADLSGWDLLEFHLDGPAGEVEIAVLPSDDTEEREILFRLPPR